MRCYTLKHFVLTNKKATIAAISILVVISLACLLLFNHRQSGIQNKPAYNISSSCIPESKINSWSSSATSGKKMSSGTSSSETKKLPITMKQAIDMGYKQAKKWFKNPQLVKAMSADTFDTPSKVSGVDGKRRTWSMIFLNPNNYQHCYFYIVDGNIVEDDKPSAYSDVFKEPTIHDKDITMTDTEALQIAVKKKGLKPGNPESGWAVGYHFELEYASYYPNQNKQYLVMEVYGTSPKGNFAHVDIDVKTQKIIYAGEESSFDKDGQGVWTDF